MFVPVLALVQNASHFMLVFVVAQKITPWRGSWHAKIRHHDGWRRIQ